MAGDPGNATYPVVSAYLTTNKDLPAPATGLRVSALVPSCEAPAVPGGQTFANVGLHTISSPQVDTIRLTGPGGLTYQDLPVTAIPGGGSMTMRFPTLGVTLALANLTGTSASAGDIVTALLSTGNNSFWVVEDGVTLVSANVAAAVPQTYRFSSLGIGSLTLTGDDLSSQTIALADVAANQTAMWNFPSLGISLIFQANANGIRVFELNRALYDPLKNSLVVVTAP